MHIAGFSTTCSQVAAAAAAAAAEAEAEATAPVCEGEEGGGEAREEANAQNRGGGGGAHGEAREALEEERCATAAAARKARRSEACGSRMISVWLARSASAVGILGSGVFSVVPHLSSPVWALFSSKIFYKRDTVAFSFTFDKYCPILD